MFIDMCRYFCLLFLEGACHNLIRALSLKAITPVSPHRNCNKQKLLSPITATGKRDRFWPRNAEILFELLGLFLIKPEI